MPQLYRKWYTLGTILKQRFVDELTVSLPLVVRLLYVLLYFQVVELLAALLEHIESAV